MNYKNIGLIIMGYGFLNFWIGPEWLTAVALTIGPGLAIYGDKKNKNE